MVFVHSSVAYMAFNKDELTFPQEIAKLALYLVHTKVAGGKPFRLVGPR